MIDAIRIHISSRHERGRQLHGCSRRSFRHFPRLRRSSGTPPPPGPLSSSATTRRSSRHVASQTGSSARRGRGSRGHAAAGSLRADRRHRAVPDAPPAGRQARSPRRLPPTAVPPRPADKSATAPAKVNPLVGLAVFSSDGSKMGTVQSVSAAPDGSVKAIHIKTGGFLGFGGKLVAIPEGRFTKSGDAHPARHDRRRGEQAAGDQGTELASAPDASISRMRERAARRPVFFFATLRARCCFSCPPPSSSSLTATPVLCSKIGVAFLQECFERSALL